MSQKIPVGSRKAVFWGVDSRKRKRKQEMWENRAQAKGTQQARGISWRAKPPEAF